MRNFNARATDVCQHAEPPSRARRQSNTLLFVGYGLQDHDRDEQLVPPVARAVYGRSGSAGFFDRFGFRCCGLDAGLGYVDGRSLLNPV